MSSDLYSGAIRRALIPQDQAEALEKLPGWGPASFNDDFTPLEGADAAGEELEDQREVHEQKVDLPDMEELHDDIQATGGFLDFQAPPQFASSEEGSEEEREVSKADSYNEAFEDGTEDAATLESQPDLPEPAQPLKELRFDDFQPMTQDPGFDSLLPFESQSAPQGLTLEAESDEEGPSGTAADHPAIMPENGAQVAEAPTDCKQSPPQSLCQTIIANPSEKQEVQTGEKEETQTGVERIGQGQFEPRRVAEGRRDDEDEDEYLDAVAEPASSQETATRVGRSRGQKRGANGAAAGEPAAKRPPTPLPRPIARCAAISKRVHAAAKAAEAARDLSTRAGTSSAFTAATALSKNVAPLSNSSLQPRAPVTISKPGSAGGQQKSSDVQRTQKLPLGTPGLPGHADRGLSGSGGAGHAKEQSLQQVPGPKKPEEVRGAQLAPVEDKFIDRLEVAATPPITAVRGDNKIDGPERSDPRECGATDSGVHRKEGGRSESGVATLVENRDAAREGGAGRATKQGSVERQESDVMGRGRDGDTSRQARPGSTTGAVERRQPGEAAGASSAGLLPQGRGAARLSTDRLETTERNPTGTVPELPAGMETEVGVNAGNGKTMREASELGEEQTGDSMSADELPGESPKAWEVLQGTVQGDSLKVHWPEMTVGEFRTRQSFPRTFAEVVHFWPRSRPERLPTPPANLLTIAIDAGLWRPPPFYRGKRPQLGKNK